MMNNNVVIDLTDMSKNKSALSGRPMGMSARKDYNMDNIDNSDCNVIIKIPAQIDVVGSSFILGFLSPSFNFLDQDKEAFFNKFSFEYSNKLEDQMKHNLMVLTRKGSVFDGISK